MPKDNVDAIEESVQTFILSRIPQSHRQNITIDDLLLEKGLLDSLGVLDVVTFLEEEFQVQIDDEELTPENFQSIRTIAEFVREKSKNHSSSI